MCRKPCSRTLCAVALVAKSGLAALEDQILAKAVEPTWSVPGEGGERESAAAFVPLLPKPKKRTRLKGVLVSVHLLLSVLWHGYTSGAAHPVGSITARRDQSLEWSFGPTSPRVGDLASNAQLASDRS